MVHYCKIVSENVERTVCARADNVKCSFKNTHQTAAAVRGRRLLDAREYLTAVVEKKRCIPFTRFNDGVGRTAQAKEFKLTQGRWPEKSAKNILALIQNLEANAKAKGLDPAELVISHIVVQRAAKGRRRTFRAHGRVTPYCSHPCHIELICSPMKHLVPKAPTDETHVEVKLSKAANAAREIPLAE
uniref:Large ribosomal subunit protein uL22 n=1 Tax=Dermatophagoides pteronyssinus TaxID=6956 RepID=A0A6P6Y7B8_DERPT|nr:60S ribosomal protein L17-like [Dermatophagoides pteronyssinus]